MALDRHRLCGADRVSREGEQAAHTENGGSSGGNGYCDRHFERAALSTSSIVYRAFSFETGIVGFVRNQDATFNAYRYLAQTPGVAAVWHPDRGYFNVPGYYYLHRKIPLYVGGTSFLLFADPNRTPLDAITSSVTHIVTEDPALDIPGYSLDRAFGALRILRRDADEPAVRQWVHYAPTFHTGVFGDTARQLYPDAPPVPPNAGIRFTDDPIPATSATGPIGP